MAKSIKLKNNKYWDSESVSHNKKNLKTILNNLKLEFTGVYNLELVGGDTYQLDLPENTVFIEPLLYSDGSRYSGGQFLVLGGSYSYFTNTNMNPGAFIVCDANGLVSISNYSYKGTKITGFRVYYLKKG